MEQDGDEEDMPEMKSSKQKKQGSFVTLKPKSGELKWYRNYSWAHFKYNLQKMWVESNAG